MELEAAYRGNFFERNLHMGILVAWELPSETDPPSHSDHAKLTGILTHGAIPRVLGRLKEWRHLGQHSNWLTSLPQEVGQLQDLEWLTLNYNGEIALPLKVGQHRQLKHLLL